MNLEQCPAPWPPLHSIANHLARFLVANARRYGGNVPLREFYEAYPLVDSSQVTDATAYLRKRYGYFCRKQKRQFVYCALDWPHVTRTRLYDERGNWKWVYSKPIPDPLMLASPHVKAKHPDPYSILYRVFVYILRHRAPGTHELEASYLYQTYGGAKRVQGMFSRLNKFYGFNIHKKNPGNPDRIWIIDRLKNSGLKPPSKHAPDVD